MYPRLWIYCFIIILGLSSCRFSTPIFKVKYRETELPDSIYTTKGAWYHYFRISRYGVVGTYTKQVTTDSLGNVVKVRKCKLSALVSDGYMVSHRKIMEYTTSGNLLKKTYEITKERGWYQAIQKEKVIIYPENGKRKVTRTRD